MAWSYQLITLDDDQKHARRLLLNRYGAAAQLSALAPIIAYQLYRLGVWVYSERLRSKTTYSSLGSTARKKYKQTNSGAFATKSRAAKWWLETELATGWGPRWHWIAGVSWATWLLFLCVYETGDGDYLLMIDNSVNYTNNCTLDYLHVTKRFGHVAAAQFPLHYMLTMKSIYSPLAMIFQSSHEQLNPFHRISGRVIYLLLLNHAVWYMNYFVQAGIVYKRLTEFIVLVGITSFLCITVLFTTAIEAVRRWNYRVFFVLHFVLGLFTLPLLFFHVKELRLYMAETLALFIIDLTCRKLDTTTGLATVMKIPGTKLVKLKIPVPPKKLERFAAAPGQHVYLSIPPSSRPSNAGSGSIHDFLFNPFTVAEVSSTDVTLVMRTGKGPTTLAIETLANLTKAKPPIDIEGPYGAAKRFPNLVDQYDRVLLIAGGVGATFILPIYRSLRDEMESESTTSDRLKLVWSMRAGTEASWAFHTPAEPSLEDDEHVKIYLTRGNTDDRPRNQTAGGSVELDDLQQTQMAIKATGGRERPDLKKIIDDVFKFGNEERIAILVCGPGSLARDSRKHVASWVMKGREVWWHDETLYANISLILFIHEPPTLTHSIYSPNEPKMLTSCASSGW